jgi:hypothetical protein
LYPIFSKVFFIRTRSACTRINSCFWILPPPFL